MANNYFKLFVFFILSLTTTSVLAEKYSQDVKLLLTGDSDGFKYICFRTTDFFDYTQNCGNEAADHMRRGPKNVYLYTYAGEALVFSDQDCKNMSSHTQTMRTPEREGNVTIAVHAETISMKPVRISLSKCKIY